MDKKHKMDNSSGISIGDVSKICGVPCHTIRYWEREFIDELLPSRTCGKQRRYSDDDINKILRIKNLLWTENFSIKGAKRIFKGNLILSRMNNSKKVNNTNIHDLAMQIAQLINHQLTSVESAA